MKKSTMAGADRAWDLIRVALLWARKGTCFRNRLQLTVKFVKSLHRRQSRLRRDSYAAIRLGERQFSFDDSPVFRLKMSRPVAASFRSKLPRIPCINPHDVDIDCDFEFDGRCDGEEDHDRIMSCESDGNGNSDSNLFDETAADDYGENSYGIDLKAEQFIAKFYEQIELQRQSSYLQRCEVLAGTPN
ncbi:unnamed protein product [Cuscuta epithymum]|uniref:Cotton fiber protein n=1 Tax=Cuscuta epithymum TaxID=186058 RepID=A0AAV0DFQ6_9ASTE|nr:unnamed protein product [Cuscuta epithymum]